jgi:hypothetical protein
MLDGDTQEWVFSFSGQLSLRIASPWRMVSDERIVVGFEDDGHQFGLKAPMDAEERIRQSVQSKEVTAATFNQYGDLEVRFGRDSTLQVFNHSAGYEGWQLHGPGNRYIVAQGGGRVIASEE